jgi:hypothetical protein
LSAWRYPRKTVAVISILEGCQNFCDLFEVVKLRALSGGVGSLLARAASTPGYHLAALRAAADKRRLQESEMRPGLLVASGNLMGSGIMPLAFWNG